MSSSGANTDANSLPQRLIDEMHAIFGKHPGYRVAHPKGILLEGTFVPSDEAQSLTIAPHFNMPSTPVIGRFSVGGGIPHVADNDPGANPKAFAVRFVIDDNTNADIICQSFPYFPTRTGEEFLDFLYLFRMSESGDKGAVAAFQAFLASHPAALAFSQTPSPNPVSFGTLTYNGVNTHVFTNQDGVTFNIRYRVVPAAGDHLLSDDDAKKASPNYLDDELAGRLPANPVVLYLFAQVADDDDVVDDASIPYKSTTFVPMGTITLTTISDDNAAKQKEIMFNPKPTGIDGIQPSKDPLINTRSDVYWISGSARRQEKQTE